MKIIIPESKLTDYLLSLSHPIGHSKAVFFNKHGFHEDNHDLFKQQLEKIAQEGQKQEAVLTPFGTKNVIEGKLDSPLGHQVTIITVWMENKEKTQMSLVTAYPSKGETAYVSRT